MTLDELRRQIDELDARLVRLLGERAELVRQIGRIKRGSGTDVHQPEREEAVLRHVTAQNAGVLPDESVVRVFRTIIEECKRLQRSESN